MPLTRSGSRWRTHSKTKYDDYVAGVVAMRAQRITKVELADSLGVTESAVRKLTNPDHRSHMSQVQKALRAVGRNIKIEVTCHLT